LDTPSYISLNFYMKVIKEFVRFLKTDACVIRNATVTYTHIHTRE